MHFAQPSFLVVAAGAALVLLALLLVADRGRRKALAQLGAGHLLAGLTASLSPGRRRLKQAMALAGVTLVFVALARPQLGYRWEEAHRRGVDLMFAVDTSKSMLTQDLKPNRLERAKLAVRDLVERFPDDRVGLVAFAGTAFLQTPLTLDHAIFEQSLDTLDTSIIPLGGTDVASAIETAGKALSDEQHRKVLVLLTDGEDLQGDALAAAEAAGKAGLVIDTVGVGTPRGELVPAPTKDGQPQFVRDEQGKLVTSRLDEGFLRRIAQASGGTYRALGEGGTGLEALYKDALATLPQSDLSTRTERVPIERYQWPLGAGLLLLAFEPLVGERRRRRLAMPGAVRVARRGGPIAAAAGAALATTILFNGTASASPQSAERAYRGGHFDQAATDYASAQKSAPDDARLGFDLGDAAYRKGDFIGAARAFEGTLRTDDLKLQTQAYYNLGNARYRIGEQALAAKDVDATLRYWKQAISHYEGALALDAKDQQARDNLEFVKRRVADLERQQEQKKQDDKKQDDKKEQDKSQSSNDGKKQDGKNQGGKNQPNGNGSSGSQDKRDAQNQPGQQTGKNGNPNGAPKGPQPQPGESAGNQPGQNPLATQPKTGQASPTSTRPQGEPSDDAPSPAGELSKKEARALLDSLRGDLAVMARAPLAPNAPAADQAPRKDW